MNEFEEIFEQYAHTLIPKESQFAPQPEQIIGFLDTLLALGAAPLDSRISLAKLSGRGRCFTDPLTGAKKSFPAYDWALLERTSDLRPLVETLQDYSVALDGRGPPKVPPFQVYANGQHFTESYGFIVRCCLRKKPVSMSEPGVREGIQFGFPCDAGNKALLLSYPPSRKVFRRASTGCARFWIEFEFGRWLLPRIDGFLEILDPSIVIAAEKHFRLAFEQGFHLF